MMPILASLQDRFRGCLLGATVGDVIGAVVEAESPQYIANTFHTVDEILLTHSVKEFTGPDWQVGRFTDDTQMMLCVTEWLIEDEPLQPEKLLARFADAFDPWRRYGSGTAGILRLYPHFKGHWRELSTAMFPEGSHGNGSAMRVAPVGLAFRSDPKKVISVVIESSRSTHSHTHAYQGAVLQAIAVSTASTSTEINASGFLQRLRAGLLHFSDLLQDTTAFTNALNEIERGLARSASCMEMSNILGTGIAALEAVPMALYCFLRNPHSYVDVIRDAVFIGGDTDTIASMAGAIAGAFLGSNKIPSNWIDAIREEEQSAARITTLADSLFSKFGP